MTGENEQIERPDMSKIKDGQSVSGGYLFDENDNLIGPVPMKKYESQEEYSADLKNIKEENEKEIRMVSWQEIDSMVFPKDRWIINNLVPKGGMVILASISGEGKTWVGFSFAKSISTGTDFLGREEFKTVQRKVLYIDAENPKHEIQRRGRQMSFIENENLSFSMIDNLNLNDEEKAEELIELIEENQIQVVILDTFRAVAGGLKEEKADEIRSFFQRFKKLKNSDVTLIWLDHYRKPANHEGKLPKKEFLFGSQDKTANTEVLLMMKKDGDEISLFQRKNRLGREILPFKMLLVDTVDSDGTQRISLEYGGEIDEKEAKKDIAKEFIPNILAEGPKTTKVIKEILKDQNKIGEKNVRDALKELESEGVIKWRQKGQAHEYFLNVDNQDVSSNDPDPDDIFDDY